MHYRTAGVTTYPPPSYVRGADGTSIAWYDFGGEGPDLLLAHATGFCGAIWQPVATLLAPYARCITYDLRGHGHSASPDPSIAAVDAWNWRRYADDTVAVLQAAGTATPVRAVGHSCGGATALLAEQQYPNTFSSLYLYEPVIFAVDPPSGPDPNRELAVRTLRRRRTFPSRVDALETFRSRGPFTTLDPEALEAYVDEGFMVGAGGEITLRCSPEDEANVYVMASDHDGYGRLGEVACPVSVAVGTRSTSFTVAGQAAVADRLPRGRLEPWQDAGHFGPLEDPRAFAQKVISMLDL